MAKRGYSRDHRPDCKQVCIGLVVTRQGFPIGYEVFDGNRTDVTTVEDMVEAMEAEVKLRVCEQSLTLFDLTMDDVIDRVKVLGATSIIDLALNADHVMYF